MRRNNDRRGGARPVNRRSAARGTSLAAAAVVLVLSSALAAQNARELYQRGLVQEHAAGNLQEAIALYSQAAEAAGRDRALAARALIRIGASHEKLGRAADAAAVYTRVVSAYPEQRAEATVAQERLASLRASASGAAAGAERRVQDVSGITTPFFATYCTDCHDARRAAGGLDLTSANAADVGDNTAFWETVVRRLRARRDPPAGVPTPDDKSRRSVVARIEQALDASYAASGALRTSERVTDVELAGRIASLIWNDAPDSGLLDAARRGELRDPALLERQIRRMLADRRSAALVAGFFTEWLDLDRLSKASPDRALFPDAGTGLLEAMATETRLFLESQLRDDRDAVEVWTAGYTFVNERLARHYGIPGVAGPQFRRVAWPDDRRAGILGQAGPLTALSFAGRTSPTIRGVYILRRFLGLDAPEPPANVASLETAPPAPVVTVRERMEAHKTNPSCASCHVMFDPLGFALENFDASGAWRAADAGTPVDASGSFTDGTRFDGPAGLRAGLLKHREAYYSGVVTRLLAYALNRRGSAGRVHDYEMAAVRSIVGGAEPKGYRWSAILTGIVSSAPFQMKRIVP